MISIHALLAESDGDKDQVVKCLAHISIHALLAESDSETVPCRPDADISIHALLAESDFKGDHGHMSGDISIHALLAESDLPRPTPCPSRGRFLSTLSLRRATRTGYQGRADRPHFYPRSPCGERPAGPDRQGAGPGISIHALLAESDQGMS